MRKLLLSFSLLFVGCGVHNSSNSYFQKTGEVVRGDKITQPLQLMQAAIFDGDESAVIRLLESGFSVDQSLETGYTPLAESLLRQKGRLIRLFLSHGASIELVSIEGQGAIEWASAQGSAKDRLLRALLKTDSDDREEIFDAVEAAQFRAIKSLIEEGVDVNVFNEAGETCFTLAISKKLVNSLRALLAAPGLDINLKNKKGESPLRLAQHYKLKSVVNELKKRNAQE